MYKRAPLCHLAPKKTENPSFWLNLLSGMYHLKGQHWYGRTKSAAFVCKQEADKAGDRGPLNGQ